jgi:hypothetical protein
MPAPDQPSAQNQLAFFDELAALTLEPDKSFALRYKEEIVSREMLA